MALSKLFDDLDNLITNHRPVSEIKPVLTLLRDQAEALDAAHTALNASYATLAQEKSAVDDELAHEGNTTGRTPLWNPKRFLKSAAQR